MTLRWFRSRIGSLIWIAPLVADALGFRVVTSLFGEWLRMQLPIARAFPLIHPYCSLSGHSAPAELQALSGQLPAATTQFIRRLFSSPERHLDDSNAYRYEDARHVFISALHVPTVRLVDPTPSSWSSFLYLNVCRVKSVDSVLSTTRVHFPPTTHPCGYLGSCRIILVTPRHWIPDHRSISTESPNPTCQDPY